MTILRAATCLGDNTTPILEQVVAHLTAATGQQVRAEEAAPWSSPDAMARSNDVDLLWACGLLTMQLIDSGRLHADIAAAPVFPGQSEPVYHAVVVARRDAGFRAVADLLGSRLAVNERASWSGNHGFVDHLHRQGRSMQLFSKVLVTGSHRRSVEALGDGAADVASIDHTVWAHLAATTDLCHELTVIERTRDWPAPPFCLRRSMDKKVRAELRHALMEIGPGDIDGLERVVAAHPTDYDHFRSIDLGPAGQG